MGFLGDLIEDALDTPRKIVKAVGDTTKEGIKQIKETVEEIEED